MSKLQRPKGTQDIFGDDVQQWQRVESEFRLLMQSAGYQEIRTPLFEYTDLFKRGVGESTDIVNKEMYTFEKGERSLTLRPEGTAGVVRGYIEQGLSRWPKPVKLFYIGAMFRYERPQAGRQRQFHQMGMEQFGLDTPQADAEAIILAMDFFMRLALPNLALEINNIGTPQCRQRFKEDFKILVAPYLEQLCENCQTRFETNALRMLDCKVPTCQAIYVLPEIADFLGQDFASEDCRQHFKELTDILDALNVPYQRNFKLVRGLDYYTKTVFEITSTHLGAQNAVCGGGRYNELVSNLGGPPTPAVGWALGLERLVSLLPDSADRTSLDYYLVSDQPAAAFELAQTLRKHGKAVEVNLSGKGFGKQFEAADKANVRHVLVLGKDELAQGAVTVKSLVDSQQETMQRSDFLARFS